MLDFNDAITIVYPTISALAALGSWLAARQASRAAHRSVEVSRRIASIEEAQIVAQVRPELNLRDWTYPDRGSQQSGIYLGSIENVGQGSAYNISATVEAERKIAGLYFPGSTDTHLLPRGESKACSWYLQVPLENTREKQFQIKISYQDVDRRRYLLTMSIKVYGDRGSENPGERMCNGVFVVDRSVEFVN